MRDIQDTILQVIKQRSEAQIQFSPAEAQAFLQGAPRG
jgi:hypothetical protein